MLELRFIRENLELVRQKSTLRGLDPDLIDRFSETDSRRLALLGEVENLKNRRNTVSRDIAEMKKEGENDRADSLIVEMRDRLDKLGQSAAGGAAAISPGQPASRPRSEKSDAVAALVALGYKPQEADRLVKAVFQEGMDSESLIRAALQSTVKGKQ